MYSLQNVENPSFTFGLRNSLGYERAKKAFAVSAVALSIIAVVGSALAIAALQGGNLGGMNTVVAMLKPDQVWTIVGGTGLFVIITAVGLRALYKSLNPEVEAGATIAQEIELERIDLLLHDQTYTYSITQGQHVLYYKQEGRLKYKAFKSHAHLEDAAYKLEKREGYVDIKTMTQYNTAYGERLCGDSFHGAEPTPGHYFLAQQIYGQIWVFKTQTGTTYYRTQEAVPNAGLYPEPMLRTGTQFNPVWIQAFEHVVWDDAHRQSEGIYKYGDNLFAAVFSEGFNSDVTFWNTQAAAFDALLQKRAHIITPFDQLENGEWYQFEYAGAPYAIDNSGVVQADLTGLTIVNAEAPEGCFAPAYVIAHADGEITEELITQWEAAAREHCNFAGTFYFQDQRGRFTVIVDENGVSFPINHIPDYQTSNAGSIDNLGPLLEVLDEENSSMHVVTNGSRTYLQKRDGRLTISSRNTTTVALSPEHAALFWGIDGETIMQTHALLAPRLNEGQSMHETLNQDYYVVEYKQHDALVRVNPLLGTQDSNLLPPLWTAAINFHDGEFLSLGDGRFVIYSADNGLSLELNRPPEGTEITQIPPDAAALHVGLEAVEKMERISASLNAGLTVHVEMPESAPQVYCTLSHGAQTYSLSLVHDIDPVPFAFAPIALNLNAPGQWMRLNGEYCRWDGDTNTLKIGHVDGLTSQNCKNPEYSAACVTELNNGIPLRAPENFMENKECWGLKVLDLAPSLDLQVWPHAVKDESGRTTLRYFGSAGRRMECQRALENEDYTTTNARVQRLVEAEIAAIDGEPRPRQVVVNLLSGDEPSLVFAIDDDGLVRDWLPTWVSARSIEQHYRGERVMHIDALNLASQSTA